MNSSGDETKCKERPCCSFRRVTRIKMQIHPLHYNTQKMNNNVTLHRANLLKSSSQTMSTTRYTQADAVDVPLWERGRSNARDLSNIVSLPRPPSGLSNWIVFRHLMNANDQLFAQRAHDFGSVPWR